jgi:hypothetical protein
MVGDDHFAQIGFRIEAIELRVSAVHGERAYFGQLAAAGDRRERRIKECCEIVNKGACRKSLAAS